MTIAIITEAGVRKVAPLVVVAQQAAASAALSAQVALAVADGRIFATYAAGNAATSTGQYFIVASSGALALHIHGTATALVNIAIVDPSTGVLLLPNGSAATPSASFASDPDTGIYRVGANSLGFAVAGVLAGYFNASGRLSVGTGATNYLVNVAWANPARGIVADFANSDAAPNGAQISFTQNGINNWCIGQTPGVDAFSIYAGRNAGADGTEVIRFLPGGLANYADDTAAAAGGVPIKGLYRTGSAVKIRVA